jgi:vacuolar protein sorting-associated protein 13A/C
VSVASPSKFNLDLHLTQASRTLLQMNPLADISISGTNLLAHGRLELMNAVMITSMAASTFNSQLDAWEPVVEPWEGLVKWESNNDPSEQALPAGARLRIAASSVLNVNVNSSAVEMIVGAQTAWKRNTELEEEAKKELQLVSLCFTFFAQVYSLCSAGWISIFVPNIYV